MKKFNKYTDDLTKYDNLKMAIVKQTVKDYITLLKRNDKKPKNYELVGDTAHTLKKYLLNGCDGLISLEQGQYLVEQAEKNFFDEWRKNNEFI